MNDPELPFLIGYGHIIRLHIEWERIGAMGVEQKPDTVFGRVIDGLDDTAFQKHAVNGPTRRKHIMEIGYRIGLVQIDQRMAETEGISTIGTQGIGDIDRNLFKHITIIHILKNR